MEKVFYWASVLNGLDIALVVSFIISCIVFTIWVGFLLSELTDYSPDEELISRYKNGTLWSFVISLFLCLGIVFIPDKQTFLLMKGSKAVEEMYRNNETLQELPQNTVNLINEYVKTLTKELQEDESSK